MQNENKNLNKQIYHLSCNVCNYTWWSKDPFPEFCPYCKNDRRIIVGEKSNAK